jgi:hypothetical protein
VQQEGLRVIAERSDEAIHSSFVAVDRFAVLAITFREKNLPPFLTTGSFSACERSSAAVTRRNAYLNLVK